MSMTGRKIQLMMQVLGTVSVLVANPHVVIEAQRRIRATIAEYRYRQTEIDRWADDGGPCP